MPSASLVKEGQECEDADQVLPAVEPLSESHLLPSNLLPVNEVVSRASPIMMKLIHLEGKHRPVCDGAVSVTVPPGMQNDEVVKESPSVDSSPSHGKLVQAGSSDELKACLGNLDLAPCVLSVNYESQPLGVPSRESPELRVSLHLPDSKDASFAKDPLHLEGQHIPICAGEVLDDVSFGMPSEATVEDAPLVISTPCPHAVQRDLAPNDDSAFRIAFDVERLRKQLMEVKD
ncbi:hypothetical protein Nepgr_024013 [Nepenthes gracilis]|uniref:Uncharacterized protein n=1 Tax=Nepenthes gracilis TaxID=150966 RepID=A0AAD3XZM8_NEPGR|nr:hypothetical protein Nepgr_024013 [Nepenthes gracilis]